MRQSQWPPCERARTGIMYHPYSRPGSPSLPNPLLDRALQHRAGSEAKSDSTMAAQVQPPINAARSRNSVSPQAYPRRDTDEAGGESSTRMGASPRMGMMDQGEDYRNGSSSMRANAFPPMRRSRSPGSNAYPDSRGGSPPVRGYRRLEGESSRREPDSFVSRTPSGMAGSPRLSEPHAAAKRCSDCGRTESEVGLILPLTEDGGKQVCKGCCKFDLAESGARVHLLQRFEVPRHTILHRMAT